MSAMEDLTAALELLRKLVDDGQGLEAVDLLERTLTSPLTIPIDFNPDGGEEWIELYRYPWYLVSTRGRLYSTLSRAMIRPQWRARGRQRNPSLQWSVYSNTRGVDGRIFVGCAVGMLSSFVEVKGSGYTPEFLDGDPTNLRLENLRWIATLTRQRAAGYRI